MLVMRFKFVFVFESRFKNESEAWLSMMNWTFSVTNQKLSRVQLDDSVVHWTYFDVGQFVNSLFHIHTVLQS